MASPIVVAVRKRRRWLWPIHSIVLSKFSCMSKVDDTVERNVTTRDDDRSCRLCEYSPRSQCSTNTNDGSVDVDGTRGGDSHCKSHIKSKCRSDVSIDRDIGDDISETSMAASDTWVDDPPGCRSLSKAETTCSSGTRDAPPDCGTMKRLEKGIGSAPTATTSAWKRASQLMKSTSSTLEEASTSEGGPHPKDDAIRTKGSEHGKKDIVSTANDPRDPTSRPIESEEGKHDEQNDATYEDDEEDHRREEEGDEEEEDDQYNIDYFPLLDKATTRYSMAERSHPEEEILFTEDCRTEEGSPSDDEESYDDFSDVSSLTRCTLSSEAMEYPLQMKMIPDRISMKTIKSAIHMKAKLRRVRKIRSMLPAFETQRQMHSSVVGEEKCSDSINSSAWHRGPPSSFAKCLVMLICPKQKIFEIVPVDYQPDTSTVDDLLAQIPLRACSDFRLRFQQYTGLLHLDTARDVASRDATNRTKSKINGSGCFSATTGFDVRTMDAVRPVNAQYSLDYHSQQMAPLVAIPVHYTAHDMEICARMLLDNPRVARSLGALHDLLVSGIGF